MKKGRPFMRSLVGVLILIVILLTACQQPGETSAPTEPPLTEGPVQTEEPAPTEEPVKTEEPTQTGEPLPPTTESPGEWLGVICPDTSVLPDDPIYQPSFGEIVQEGELFTRQGEYVNPEDHVFDITVKGKSREAVAEYTDKLKVCMELLDPVEPDFETDVTDEVEASYPGEDQTYDAHSAGLVIAMNPAEKMQELFQDGYIWVFIIDPSISNGVPHDYRKYCRDSAKTTVTTGANAGVSATHYKDGSSSPRSLGANAATTWTYSTRATYDLKVVGTASGSYRYGVSGTVWNFGFYSPAPGGGGSSCQ